MKSELTPEKLLPERFDDSHKGTYGRTLIAAGSPGMAGAAYLAGLAAYRSGCGLVELFTHEDNRIILQQLLPEAVMTVYTTAEEVREKLPVSLARSEAVAAGCGIGLDERAEAIVETICAEDGSPAAVLDADALTILAGRPDLLKLLGSREAVITPHPKEMSRLNGLSIGVITGDRQSAAENFSGKYGITCLLKGHRTIVAGPGMETYENHTGNDGMAVGGSGDVLTGIIGSFLAQGLDAFGAACLGAFLHGAGGDEAARTVGRRGMMARDIADGFVRVLKKYEH